jgi:hypothetical protein
MGGPEGDNDRGKFCCCSRKSEPGGLKWLPQGREVRIVGLVGPLDNGMPLRHVHD